MSENVLILADAGASGARVGAIAAAFPSDEARSGGKTRKGGAGGGAKGQSVTGPARAMTLEARRCEPRGYDVTARGRVCMTDALGLAASVAETAEGAGLHMAGASVGVLLPHYTNAIDLQRLSQIFFEAHGASRVFLGCAPVCALFSTGLTSGTVVDVGFLETRITPIASAAVLPIYSSRLPHLSAARSLFAAADAAASAGAAVGQAGPFATYLARAAACGSGSVDPVRAASCVAAALAPFEASVLTAPDGAGVALPATPTGTAEAAALFSATALGVAATLRARDAALEALFTPLSLAPASPLGHFAPSHVAAAVLGGASRMSSLGLMDATAAVLRQVPADCGATRHVLCVGGGAAPSAVADKFRAEFAAAAPRLRAVAAASTSAPQPHSEFKTVVDRRNAAWAGATLFAQIPSFAEVCLTRAQYDEHGPSATRLFGL
jgi:hypothetical protein